MDLEENGRSPDIGKENGDLSGHPFLQLLVGCRSRLDRPVTFR